MQLLLIAAWVLATGWAVITIHELGHYLAGLAVGVPRQAMRIQLGRSPHVALRQGLRWVAPDERGYVRVFARHNPGLAAAWVFTAGGVVNLLLFIEIYLEQLKINFFTCKIVVVSIFVHFFKFVIFYIFSNIITAFFSAYPHNICNFLFVLK